MRQHEGVSDTHIARLVINSIRRLILYPLTPPVRSYARTTVRPMLHVGKRRNSAAKIRGDLSQPPTNRVTASVPCIHASRNQDHEQEHETFGRANRPGRCCNSTHHSTGACSNIDLGE